MAMYVRSREEILPGFDQEQFTEYLEDLNDDEMFLKQIEWDESYARFLASYNGACVLDGEFLGKSGFDYDFQYFHHFSPELCEQPQQSEFLPDAIEKLEAMSGERLLPIATCSNNDAICFDYGRLDLQGRPSIVICNHAKSDPLIAVEDYTDFIATSFEEFLDMVGFDWNDPFGEIRHAASRAA